MWESLKRFKALPDHIQVHPAHGAGSACGKALGAIPSSTVGYEKIVNWALQHTNEDDFVAELLSGQPEPPFYFAMMKKLNKVERDLLVDVPTVSQLTVAEVDEALASKRFVIDTRSKVAFAAGHLSGSVNIQNNKSFSNWAGWVLNYDEPFVLIAAQEDVEELTRKLMRIGLDNIQGFYPGVSDWQEAGAELATVRQMDVEELRERYDQENLTVIDVRGISEHESGHIPGAINIHTGHLTRRLAEIPTDRDVVIACQAGDRSSIAMGLLQREGLTNLWNFPKGFAGWAGAKCPIETGIQEVSA